MRYQTKPTTSKTVSNKAGFTVYAEMDIWRPNDDEARADNQDAVNDDLLHVHICCSSESTESSREPSISSQSGMIPTLKPGDSAIISVIADVSGVSIGDTKDDDDDVSNIGVTLGIQVLWSGKPKQPSKSIDRYGDFLALMRFPPHVLYVPQPKLQEAVLDTTNLDLLSCPPVHQPKLFYECRVPRMIVVDISNGVGTFLSVDSWLDWVNEALEGTMHSIASSLSSSSSSGALTGNANATVSLVLLAYPAWEFLGLLGFVKRHLPDQDRLVWVDSS